MTARVHYSGSLSWKLADGSVNHVTAPGPACSTGKAAQAILAAGNHSDAVSRVTCSRCRHNMHRAGILLPPAARRRDGADVEAERIIGELAPHMCIGGSTAHAEKLLAAELRKIAQGPRRWGVLR